MKNNTQRIKNIAGQLEGVAKMIEANQDPLAVLTQMKAARSALNAAMTSYIQDNFWDVISTCTDKEESCKKFFQEIININ